MIRRLLIMSLLITLCGCSIDNPAQFNHVCRDASPVGQGLLWLKNNQNSDGSWGENDDVNLLSLCLLAYSEHGETLLSTDFGESLKKALERAIAHSKNSKACNPLLSLALIQYFYCQKTPSLNKAMDNEVKQIIASQDSNGMFKNDGDSLNVPNALSQCLDLLALKLAFSAGYEYEDKEKAQGLIDAADKGLLYLKTNFYLEDKRGFILLKTDSGISALATAISVYTLQDWATSESPEAKSGLEWINSHIAADNNYLIQTSPILTNHFLTRVIFYQYGGSSHKNSTWRKWNQTYSKALKDSQSNDGSWEFDTSPFSFKSAKDRKIFSTALSILMLEVTYIYSPNHATHASPEKGGTGSIKE